MTGVDFADNLANTPAQAESLLHSKQQESLVSTWIQIKQSKYVLNKI